LQSVISQFCYCWWRWYANI